MEEKSKAQQEPGLPDYNLELGDFLKEPPNLRQNYTGVVSQIYPLRAHMSVLEGFCDKYLNFKSEEKDRRPPWRFAPAAPFVLLQVVNYAEIATRRNFGWFSQRELAFGVPLEWYEKKGSDYEFVDWAICYPFIYVDDSLSIIGGREIYGWSKARIKIDSVAPIFESPRQRCLATISLVTTGLDVETRPGHLKFLDIFQDLPLLSLRSAASDLFTAVPKALTTSINAGLGALEMIGLPPFGFRNPDLQSLQTMVARLHGHINPYLGPAFRAPATGRKSGPAPISLFTLKQVRDLPQYNKNGSVNSSAACFQALVSSEMRIDTINDGGTLIDPASADLSAGITIHLQDIDRQPVVKELGLVHETSTDPKTYPTTYLLKPVLPYWLNMNLKYGRAEQYWCSDLTDWTDASPKTYVDNPLAYVELGSGAMDELRGPFGYPEVRIRPLVLEANPKCLSKLIADYLPNENYTYALFTWEGKAYVVALLVEFEKLTLTEPGSPSYTDSELIFAIPITWIRNGDTAKGSPALVPAYTFAGTNWNAVTEREVYGRFTLHADFTGATPKWETLLLQPASSAPGQSLLTISTELFSGAGDGEAGSFPIVKVNQADQSAVPDAKALATSLEEYGIPQFANANEEAGYFYTIALKQIRDARNPAKADFQSVVWLQRHFVLEKAEARTRQPDVELAIAKCDPIPVVSKLGLSSKPSPDKQWDVVTPVFDVKLQGKMTQDLGNNMEWRVGNLGWLANISKPVKYQ